MRILIVACLFVTPAVHAQLTWTVSGSCVGNDLQVTGDNGCGAYTNEVFTGDFSVAFRWEQPSPVVPTGIDSPVGFLETPTTSIGTFVLNGFYIERGNTPPRLQITEGGALPPAYNSFNGITQYSSSNVFRIERVGSLLQTYQDDVLVHTQSGFTTNDVHLHVKAPPGAAQGSLDWRIESLDGVLDISEAVSVGALSYNPDIDEQIIFDRRNDREWLRWDVLLSAGPDGLTYLDIVDAITTGDFANQGWTISRNADGLAFVDATLEPQPNPCTVNGNFNDCGPPDGDFVGLVGQNCTSNETIAWFLSDNGVGDEAGLIDHYLASNDLLFYNERGSIAFADSVCNGPGTSWLIYRDAPVPADGIVGSWYFERDPAPGEAGGPVVITFLANGQYLQGTDGDPVSDPSGEDGLEWGTYTYDGSTLSTTALLDTNGEWGLDGAVLPVTLEGNLLTVDAGGELIVLNRIFSDTIAGAWLFDGTRDDESVVLNLLIDGSFMLVHGNSEDTCGCGQAGIEYGTYDWDPVGGAINFAIATDTNGEFGVSDPLVSWAASVVTADNLMLMDGSDSFSFTRINAADSDADGDADLHDNCIDAANADQRDTDGDGFGNLCDADLNDDCIVNALDLGVLKTVFFTADEDADLNGDGNVNALDLGLMRTRFFLPPGPSGMPNNCD